MKGYIPRFKDGAGIQILLFYSKTNAFVHWAMELYWKVGAGFLP